VERVANPYAGGTGYVNPLWKARADAEPGGTASAPRTATDARRIRWTMASMYRAIHAC